MSPSLLECLWIFIWSIHMVSSAPNIIFILNDDWGWNDVSFHGGCEFQTPNIDSLALTGMELTNYYVQHLCTPTRSTIMSGRYPIRDGLQQAVIMASAPYGMPLKLKTLPEELKRAGYSTHIVGKWHLGFFHPDYLPTSRGFDTFVGFYGGSEDYFKKNFTDDSGYNGYDFRNGTQVSHNLQYSTYIYGNESLRLMKKHVEDENTNPFFLYIPFQAPHAPFQAPMPLVKAMPNSITSGYRRFLAGAMAALDDSIGQMVSYLKSEESGHLWDNTLLIVSSDNGGDVDDKASNWPLRGTKGTLYEGGVKAIGIVNGGWLSDDVRGTQMNALMHSTDWFVTLQAVAGIKPSVDYKLDGMDQIDNLKFGDRGDFYTPRSTLLHNIYEWSGALRWRDFKLMRASVYTKCHSTWCPNTQFTDNSQTHATVQCTNEMTNFDHPDVDFIADCSYNKKFCLFNIHLDPCEYYDVSEEEPEIYAMMTEMLLEFKQEETPSLFEEFPVDYEAAAPMQFPEEGDLEIPTGDVIHWTHDSVWGPWIDREEMESITDGESYGENVLAVIHASLDSRPQQLLAPLGVLLSVGIFVVLLQCITKFTRRQQQKGRKMNLYQYGTV